MFNLIRTILCNFVNAINLIKMTDAENDVAGICLFNKPTKQK